MRCQVSRQNTLNQQLAAAIQEIATGAIHAIVDVARSPAARSAPGKSEDDVTDAKGLDELLRPQEGVLSRRGTVLGTESAERYAKGKPVHDASGKFRRSDAKG
jgi:hypothetical protein